MADTKMVRGNMILRQLLAPVDDGNTVGIRDDDSALYRLRGNAASMREMLANRYLNGRVVEISIQDDMLCVSVEEAEDADE